ncbi:MAG: DNA polymerase III subunit gamma/tau [Bacteroidia bacterium]|nr:DNA polymerase III subunit gamma/tau [Bacteroidia bacterium]
MDNFIVSARKYRPQTFRTVVGQQHITGTLKNAILQKHLAQAFLFCGPRGVGKTTCARILAKTINCFNVTADGEACDVCDSCTSFNNGQSLNVYELDAASNNSVDDIRQLVEQVRFAPQLGSHRVYIIDEVHMLSTAAFNAFLKTLEEPPKHAIFILATTEKHKIIPTILSRCQIFDFNRIKIEDMASHLAWIAKTEGIAAEEEALRLIAQKADGGLRDACSMFDQMVSFSGNNITYKTTAENLHVLDYDYYFKVGDFILEQKLPDVLLIFDEILKRGFDGHNFVVGLAEHLRNLLVCKDVTTLQLLEVSENVKLRYSEQSQKAPLMILLKALSILNKCDISFKAAKNQRLHVEMALMQLTFLAAPPQQEAEKKNDVSEQNGTSQSASVANSDAKGAFVPTSKEVKTVKTSSTPLTNIVTLKPKTQFSLSDSVSVMAKTDKADEKKNDVAEELLRDKELNIEEVRSAIFQYAEEKFKTSNRLIYSTLTSHQAELGEENGSDSYRIIIPIHNEVQSESFREHSQHFLDFLRKQLFNRKITFAFSERDVVQQEKKIYSAKEKYHHLAAKNPLVAEISKRFNLELDF